MNERRLQIIKDISENDKISVSELAARYGVSQVTIRNDLKVLQQNGLIRRIHGGASSERIANRFDSNYEIKLRIADKAAEMIESGETIMIESGSTNALLAKKLGETKDVTIVTNSYFIANFAKESSRLKFVLLGGDFQPDSEVCVGPLARQAMQAYYVEHLFIGSDGFSEKEGFTNNNLQRAEVALDMAKRAKEVIILTDSSKFMQRGVVLQLPFSEITMVITDDGIPDEARKALSRHNVKLITVPK